MKKLPISRQDFRELINENCIYIDKTPLIYRLITTGFEYFFSRPRRFGKSLLITTLREIFLGNREIFKGLWIYDKIEWIEYPVIEIYFNKLPYNDAGLREAISMKLDSIADEYNIEFKEKYISEKFRQLIQTLGAEKKVVLLIDEYDKPIIDYLDDLPRAEGNRDILKNFYSIIKGSEQYIKFLFITGVSKFSKVSIFSDLNHLSDITLDEAYNQLVGITQNELKHYFSEYTELLQLKYKDIYPNIYKALEEEYLGYSWNGIDYVYNPYCMLNVLDKRSIQDWWFQSGTPTFLIKLIKNNNYTALDIRNKKVSTGLLDKYILSDLTLLPLMFQTGYLTIKNWDLSTNLLTLDFPNKEVERSISVNLLAEFNGKKSDKTESMLSELSDALKDNDIEYFIENLNILLEGLTYMQAQKKENYFHSIFYLVVNLLGFVIESEVLTIRGRIDCVIKTNTHIYIIEFKMDTAKKAIAQIKEKKYHLKYMHDKRSIQLIGIAFDADEKCIKEYLIETVK